MWSISCSLFLASDVCCSVGLLGRCRGWRRAIDCGHHIRHALSHNSGTNTAAGSAAMSIDSRFYTPPYPDGPMHQMHKSPERNSIHGYGRQSRCNGQIKRIATAYGPIFLGGWEIFAWKIFWQHPKKTSHLTNLTKYNELKLITL